MEKKLYTLIVFSENIAGILSQITAVFTRRQVNIESLNVSASSIEGVHKYTITILSDKETANKITLQIEKKIEVLKANYYTDDDVFIMETALYKVATEETLHNSRISKIVRQHEAHIVEVNSTYCVIEKSGMTEDIISLYKALNEENCLFQYVRSGRIAITRARREALTAYLNERCSKSEVKNN